MGLNDTDDDQCWNLDQVLTQLKAAWAELKAVQHQSQEKCYKEKHDEGLQQCLKEEEERSMDSTDPHAVEKMAKIEAIIQSEHQQASYTKIKQVFKYTAYGGHASNEYMFPKLMQLAR